MIQVKVCESLASPSFFFPLPLPPKLVLLFLALALRLAYSGHASSIERSVHCGPQAPAVVVSLADSDGSCCVLEVDTGGGVAVQHTNATSARAPILNRPQRFLTSLRCLGL